jgi:HEAT repeat protein
VSVTPSVLSEAVISPEKKEAENQLTNVLAQYPSADETTRMNTVENLADLIDKGFDRNDIAKALVSMFAMEQSAAIKSSILDELEALDPPTLFERVTPALLPNQPLEVRDEAIAILKDLGDKRAISALQPFLADPDDDIREEAEDAITHLNSLP